MHLLHWRTPMSLDQLDLEQRYRRCTIALYDSFHELRTWTKFLKDFAFNENKSVRQVNASGSRRKWACDDNNCVWFVTLALRRETQTQNHTKLSSIPPGSWYVHEFGLTQ